ncbi:MAG: hypothetical protein Fur0032_03250 [Terrimicrobiaceae bacterium]
MDAKKRVAVPASWLGKKEGEELYVVLHPSKQFLAVITPVEFLRMQDKLATAGLTPAQQQEARRLLFGGAHRVVTDAQGRVLLPEEHCRQAGLKSQVVFVGSGSRFEIWDDERFAARRAEAEALFLQAADAIGL